MGDAIVNDTGLLYMEIVSSKWMMLLWKKRLRFTWNSYRLMNAIVGETDLRYRENRTW